MKKIKLFLITICLLFSNLISTATPVPTSTIQLASAHQLLKQDSTIVQILKKSISEANDIQKLIKEAKSHIGKRYVWAS